MSHLIIFIAFLHAFPLAAVYAEIFGPLLAKSSDSPDNVITCPPISCTGTLKNDIMVGTSLDDTIYGLAGDAG